MQPHKILISFCNPIFNFQIENGREFGLAHHLILVTLYCSSAFLTRGSRFFLIAFLIGNFGTAMKKIIEKKLLKVSIIASIILIIFAFLIYSFLKNFIN